MGAEYKGALPVISDSTTGAPPLQDRRKYDLSDFFIRRARSKAPLFSILSNRMQKRSTSDPEFKHLEDGETAHKGTLTGESGGAASSLTTSGTTVIISNADNILQPNDIIHVPQNQTNNANTLCRKSGENLEVVSISGTNIVTVKRHATSAANVETKTTATNTLGWIMAGSASREGATSRDALQDTLGIGENYCQIFRESVEVTGSLAGTEMYGGSDLERQRNKKMLHTANNIERAMIHGVKARTFEAGKPKRTMGGLLYWLEFASTLSDPDSEIADYSTTNDLVSGNHTSRVHFMNAALTEILWHRFLEYAFTYGNTDKLAFCGPTFITEFQNLFTGKVQISPLAERYGLNIMMYRSPHGVVHLLHEPHFFAVGVASDPPGGYSTDVLILDIPNLEYRYTVAKGGNSKYMGARDLRLIEGIQANDADTAKEEWFAEVGIGLKSANSHSWLTGVKKTA